MARMSVRVEKPTSPARPKASGRCRCDRVIAFATQWPTLAQFLFAPLMTR